jgi:hypothetical protein
VPAGHDHARRRVGEHRPVEDLRSSRSCAGWSAARSGRSSPRRWRRPATCCSRCAA